MKDATFTLQTAMEKLLTVHSSATTLETSIYAHSKRGVNLLRLVRDIEGPEEIQKASNAWVKGYDPSIIQQMKLTGIMFPNPSAEQQFYPGMW
jgi:hypothetical protein